jgi:hypothetical protein
MAAQQRLGAESGRWTAAGEERARKEEEYQGQADGKQSQSQAHTIKAALRRAAACVGFEGLRSAAADGAAPRPRSNAAAGRLGRRSQTGGWVRREPFAGASMQAVLGEVGELEGMAGDLVAQGVPQHMLSELFHLARQLRRPTHEVATPDRGTHGAARQDRGDQTL